jgi:hypothetical protein
MTFTASREIGEDGIPLLLKLLAEFNELLPEVHVHSPETNARSMDHGSSATRLSI